MIHAPLPRLDKNPQLKDYLLRYCRLKRGEVWQDDKAGHRVACLDAASKNDMNLLMNGRLASLAVQDPPYNIVAFEEKELREFIAWCRLWVDLTEVALDQSSSLYVWLGADQRNGFQPLPDFMIMMRERNFRPRSFITMRNQRGYGTQKNWMAVRQELLYYMKGDPNFHVDAEYTDIPKY